MIFNVVQKHLRPHTINLHRPAIKTRYLFCSNIFQDVGKVNHTKFRYVPVIWGNLILQDFNISELKRLPIIILLRIQNLSVIILPKYINNMDSRDSKLTNPDNSDPCSKPGTKDMKRKFEVLQCQEAPQKAPQYRGKKACALSPGGQQYPLETPSKKMKAMGVTEAATTPEETMDKPKIIDTVSQNTYTSLDNGVKQDNIVYKATQHSLDNNKDKFFVENEVTAIKMNIEPDLIAPQDAGDSDNENEANPSQTEKADIEMKQPDADLDYQPPPDGSSSAAEANNNSAITSQNLLQDIVVRETYDTKPIIDEQPKEDNHPSPAERQDLGITRSTFSNVSHTESPEQCIQRANAWPKDGHKMSLKGECKTPHNNRTSIPNWLNPQDIASLPTDSETETEANPERQIMNPEPPETKQNGDKANAQREKIVMRSDQSKNNYDFTVNIEPDLIAPQDAGDSDNENEANPSQTEKADIEIKQPDADLDYQPPPDGSSSAAEANNNSAITSQNLQDIVVRETYDTKPILDEQPKEDNHPSPAERQGYRGLRNQGATCYLNAVLQTLFMTKDFRKVIISNKESKQKKKSLSFELQKLFEDLESNTKSATKSATTRGVTNALEIGNVCEQQDAAEYYQKILSMIEPEAAKIFQGQKKHSTTCKHGNHEPIVELISFFSLAIAMDSDQHKINVTESFEAQFEVMLMDGEDQLFCETCKRKMDMEMSCTISELPDVLTLHLQRFYLDYCYMTYKKNDCPVEIPLQLKVQDHHIYDLYALVNHTGSLSGGHYYANIKSFDDQQWYEFNDSAVRRIPKTYDVRHIISDMACLLFFKKSAKQNGDKANAQREKIVMRSDQSKNNYDFTVNIEPDLIAPQDAGDSDNENEANPSQTEKADIEMKQPDADLDYQPPPDGSSSAAEANNNSAITSQNLLQDIVVRETYDTKPIIDEQPKEDNHPSPAERQDLGITRSTFSNVSHTESPEQCIQRANAWPKEGHKMSLKGECKTPHNNRTSIPNWLNPQDIASLPTDSETETEANPERQIMNPEPPETAHNESYLDNDEAKVQYNSLLQETTVSRRKIAPSKCVLIAIIIIGIIVCIMLVLYSFYLDF